MSWTWTEQWRITFPNLIISQSSFPYSGVSFFNKIYYGVNDSDPTEVAFAVSSYNSSSIANASLDLWVREYSEPIDNHESLVLLKSIWSSSYYGNWNSSDGYSSDYDKPVSGVSTPKHTYHLPPIKHSMSFYLTGSAPGYSEKYVFVNGAEIGQNYTATITRQTQNIKLGANWNYSVSGGIGQGMYFKVTYKIASRDTISLLSSDTTVGTPIRLNSLPYSSSYTLNFATMIPIIRELPAAKYICFGAICETYYTNSQGQEVALSTYSSAVSYISMPDVGITAPTTGTLGSSASFSLTADSALTAVSCTYEIVALNASDGSEYGIFATYSSAGSKSITLGSNVGQFFPEATSLSVKWKLNVYYGQASAANLINSAQASQTTTVTAAASSSKPTPSAVLSDPTGLKDILGKYCIGQSQLECTITTGVRNGATVKSIRATVNGTYYTAENFTTEPLTATATSLVIEVTDSRNFTGTITYTLQLIEWFTPQIPTFAIHRGIYSGGVWTADDDGGWVKIEWGISVAPVGNQNTVQVKITAPDGSHTPQLPSGSGKYSASGVLYSQADTEASYTIVVEVTDSFVTFSRSSVLSTAGVILDFKAGGKGIGIGKVSETDYMFDVSPDWTVRLKTLHILVPDGATVREVSLADYIREIVSET